jgi:hypothetical protein
MGQLKRGITSILDVKKGATNINYIYRATTLIWQRGTPPANTLWLTSGLEIVLSNNSAGTNVFVTSGLNTKFK